MGQHDRKMPQLDSLKGAPSLNYEQKRIADWLKKLRFRKKLFGGVSEIDVWKKIDELNSMYNAALRAERVRYDALLEQSGYGTDAELETEEGI